MIIIFCSSQEARSQQGRTLDTERYHDRYYDAKMKRYNEKEAFLEVYFSRPTVLGNEENSLNMLLSWDEKTQRYNIANKLLAGFIKDDF